MAAGFENVRLVIADSNPQIRAGLKGALYGQGFRNITDATNLVRLHDLMEQDSVDLLVTSSELEGNFVGALVSEMRNQRLGHNPFLVVIVLLTQADPDYVRTVVNSGPDDILLTPVSPDQLMLRIQKLAGLRKPFVITHDYTGPDRRSAKRPDKGAPAPMMEVPNPLRIRVESGLDGTRMARLVGEASTNLNLMKIQRYAVQMDWLVTHIHASIRDGLHDSDASIVLHTHHLVDVAQDMLKRMQRTALVSHIPVIEEIALLASALDHAPKAFPFGEMERLGNLTKGIYRQLGSSATASSPLSGAALAG